MLWISERAWSDQPAQSSQHKTYFICEWDADRSSAAVPANPVSTFNTPAFQQWIKDVAAMPAEKQVEAVAKKLMELNPGFDGKVISSVAAGVVTTLNFSSDNVSDISPVRALAGLKSLSCEGSKAGAPLVDLSPLRDMPLKEIHCDFNPDQDFPIFRCMKTLETINGKPAAEFWKAVDEQKKEGQKP